VAHRENVFCLVPVASLQSSVNEWIAVFVQIREDSVLIAQVSVVALLLLVKQTALEE